MRRLMPVGVLVVGYDRGCAILGLDDYKRHLEDCGFSQRTVESYLWVAEFFLDNYGEPCPDTLVAYREWLVESYKPNTVNQRVQALNYYLGYVGKGDLRLKPVPVNKADADPSVDYASYRWLVRYLRGEGYWRDYHAICLMVTSGLRVSELLGLEVGDMRRDMRTLARARPPVGYAFSMPWRRPRSAGPKARAGARECCSSTASGTPSHHAALPTRSRKGPWNAGWTQTSCIPRHSRTSSCDASSRQRATRGSWTSSWGSPHSIAYAHGIIPPTMIGPAEAMG